MSVSYRRCRHQHSSLSWISLTPIIQASFSTTLAFESYVKHSKNVNLCDRSFVHFVSKWTSERDLSMDSKFQDELQTIFGTKKVVLPKVFIGGRYIGGMKEIKQLQENDELRKLIGALPPSDKIFDEICDLCRGWRFVMCDRCSGSHKIFLEKSGFTNCTSCNVQGLIRCTCVLFSDAPTTEF